MSLEEVQEVARLASQRRYVIHGSGPTATGVADALGLPPAEIERLLAEIRDRKAGYLPPDDSTMAKRYGLAAALVAAFAIVLFAVGQFLGSSRSSSGPVAAGSPGPSTERSVDPQYGSQAAPPSFASRPAAVPLSGERIDPGLSSRTMELGHEVVKDNMSDLANAQRRASSLQEEANARPEVQVMSATAR